MAEPQQDVFISHAGADKDEYVYPLAESLSACDVTYWLDDTAIGWGDSVVGRINEGLRSSQYALLCLSSNFLSRPWPEVEMSAVLSIQNASGVKAALPLILNSKDDVLRHYPLIAGLAYREYNDDPDSLAAEVARMLKRQEQDPDELSITLEGVHTGKLCHLRVPTRVSVGWLAKKAQIGLGVRTVLKASPSSEFHIRWVLVDVAVESLWPTATRSQRREIHALVDTNGGVKAACSEFARLCDLGVRNGTVFHLYAIEDETYQPGRACVWNFGV
jgi:hypothetical protein